MAFGGTGFAFGSNNSGNNQQQQPSGFGSSLFGGNNNNNNSNAGFGANTNTAGFGASTTATNPFGSNTNTFGNNNAPAFGANNAGSSLFGGNKAASTPFGTNAATTGSNLFGGATNNGGFGAGGFGSNTNTGFGANNNAASNSFAFGNTANKPAFGAAASTTPLFGQGGTGTTGGFGTSTNAFGAGVGTALNQPVPPSEGTGSTPFAPTADKEANGTSNSYQSITFQQPYQKYSFEELRLADYNAGRRFGNGSGQAGAFGSSSFGGFGSNNAGGAFGSTNTNTNNNPFGASTTAAGGFGATTATSGFGNNATGGLFGSKPAGGLFGSQPTTATPAGGFGTNTNAAFGGTTGGFGSNNTANTGGGLFGNTQNKPAGGLFGNTGQTGTTSLFGNNNNNNQPSTNAGGGLFGGSAANTGGGLFGNNQQAGNAGGLFANNNNNNINQPKPGGLFGNTGAFGSNTTQSQTTGGLFGTANNSTANTGGGLFGTANNAGAGGGLFGNANNNNNAGGGLFGTANQTANTGGGLFANNTQNQNKPGGLFGQPSTGGGLFGTNNNATSQSGGLFGTANTNAGGGLFGNNNINKPTTSLFGTNNTTQPTGGLFGTTTNTGGLFGTSQNVQQQNQQPPQDGIKHASLLDPNPYGQSSIWTGLPAASPENSKPVFTPLTASQKLKESMMKPPPSLRLNQSRYMTPPRRNGYGFTYSTYGTPNSAASTPGGAGLSGSMYGSRSWTGGSFGRSFNKSASVQNLRAQFSSDNDDLWKPGAFSSSGRHSSGSIKRLTIDRSIRNDLFSRPSQPALPALPAPPAEKTASATATEVRTADSNSEVQPEVSKFKKRVSFDNSTTGGLLNGETGALVRTESPDADDDQSNRLSNGESSSSRGQELAVVPEDQESNHVSTHSPEIQSRADPKPGEYWMKPSRAEIAKIPREQLQKFKDFQVGRRGCGQVTFNGTVDLAALSLDDLYDKIVEIRLRSVTVYPDASSKPPVGKGLNVPSTIAIENSWPRSRNQPSSVTSGPVFDKHVNRLKKMSGTEFVDYEVDTGVWTFRVPHYTRYGLDYDDDDQETNMSELSAPPDSIAKSAVNDSVMEIEADDSDLSDDNDTFAFRGTKTIPGGFGRHSAVDFDFHPNSSAGLSAPKPTSGSDMEEDDLSDRSAPYSDDDYSEDEPSMAGAYPTAAVSRFDSPNRPILRAPGTPGKTLLDLDGDWADQLQQTISPRKQNRDLLRDAQSKALLDRAYSPIKPKSIQQQQQSFRTSVDVMSSIFGKYEESRMSTNSNESMKAKSKDSVDFEFPHAKRAKPSEDDGDVLSIEERKWLNTLEERFNGIKTLVASNIRGKPRDNGDSNKHKMAFNLEFSLSSSIVGFRDSTPAIEHQKVPFSYLANRLVNTSNAQADQRERDVYGLAHVLFDTYEDHYSLDLPTSESVRAQVMPLVHKDRLSDFLSDYILRKHGEKIAQVEKENPTAAALLKLSAHDIKGACDSLEKVKNYKLMLLVSQLENASQPWQQDIRAQIDAWRDQNILSEITDDVRSMYEVCAGNVTICQGKSAPNVPVEDKAKTFSLSEEYGLDWVQCFAMGLWYGIDEKKNTSDTSVTIGDAVREFALRCERGEENSRPDHDAMWMLLKVYAALHDVAEIEMPSFPQALEDLTSTQDVSRAFRLHFAIAGNIGGVVVDEVKADELVACLAWQLSSRHGSLGESNLADAAYVLLHISDAPTRIAMLKALLERFAADLPEPPTDTGAGSIPKKWITVTKTTTAEDADLWTTLTSHLLLPPAWIFLAKALHARLSDFVGHSEVELEYLVAAQSWNEAHECLVRRVAPSCVVDADYEGLAALVDLFGTDAEQKVGGDGGWLVGGGIYADFIKLINSKFPQEMDEELIDSLAVRLTNIGRDFDRQDEGEEVDLGRLSPEVLEERVALTEMSRVVAERMGGNLKGILKLPLTSDLRLKYTTQLTADYYRDVMAQGAGNI